MYASVNKHVKLYDRTAFLMWSMLDIMNLDLRLQTVDTCPLAYFIVLASKVFKENLTNTQTRAVIHTEYSSNIPLQTFDVVLFYIFLASCAYALI